MRSTANLLADVRDGAAEVMSQRLTPAPVLIQARLDEGVGPRVVQLP